MSQSKRRYYGPPKPRQGYPQTRREVDPRQLAKEMFAEDGQYGFMQTGGMKAAREEPYSDLVSSPGWNLVLKSVFFKVMHDIRRELLTSEDITEGRRNGDIRMLSLMSAMLMEIYRRSGDETPGWVTGELEY